MRSRGFLWLLPGLVGGFCISTALQPADTGPRPGSLAAAIDQRIAAQKTVPIRCGIEVDTEDWTTLRDQVLGIEMSYPPSYVLEKTATSVTLKRADGSPQGVIRMQKVRGSISREIDRDWQLANWKMADRRTFALTTPYYTDEAGNIWMRYLLVREFPFSSEDTFTLFRVTIESPLSTEDYAKAQQAGLIDYETILTLPEQILSTFRFLRNEEYLDKLY